MRTKKPKDFKQFDSRWAKKMYSSKGNKTATMKNSGCAPSAAANVVWEFADKTVTPYTLAQLYVKKKFRKDGNGTKPGCFKWTAAKYKLRFKRLYKKDAIIDALDKGALVVAHMGKGYWTNGGHYITLWAWKDGAFYACDPGSSKRKKQADAALMKQAKGFYGFMG